MRLRALCAALAVFLSAGATAALASPLPIERGQLGGLRDLGRATSARDVRVAIVLKYHHDAELEALTEAQADPASLLYHQFLQPSQFAAYFSPSSVEYARVLNSLARGGFTITHTYANRTVVDAVAPAPIAARYFHTDIHEVLTPDGRRTYANVTAGSVPDAIGDLVLTVQGLDASARIHPLYAFGRGAGRRIQAPAVSPNNNPVFGPDGGYGPLVFVRSYLLPNANGQTGTGRASGVATDADFLDGDLNSFLQFFHVTRTGPATTRVLVDGGPQPGNGPDSIETALDVEQIVSLAPGTALYVYEVTYDEPTNANFIDIFNQVVTDNKVDTLNSSYGYCETAVPHGYPQALNAVARQGNALGITFHSASGDSGSSWDGCNGTAVAAPEDIPHNIAVGGTTLSVDANGNETNEVAWGGSGGGVSVLFKLPNYQGSVPNIIATGRNLPDLAYDADPGTGASYFYGGGWAGPIGGTSMASPIFGAALTEIDQVVGARAGYFNTTLYRKWLARGYGTKTKPYFRDVTVGNNGAFNAGPGYDRVSGIGVMLVNDFDTLLH